MKHLFGHIENEKMIFNDAGKHANKCWLDIPDYFPNIKLHAHQIMPNHMHGIIEITHRIPRDSSVRAKNVSPQSANEKPNANLISNDDAHSFDSPNALNPLDSSIYLNDLTPHDTHDANNAHRSNNMHNTRAKSVSPLPLSPVKTVGSVVRGFKTGVTTWFRLNHADEYPIGTPIWQRSFHDHIIRDSTAYYNISNYILNNPKKWKEDKFCS